MYSENIRLSDIFDFLELKVYDGKTFVYGANKFSKNANPTIKKKYNFELNDASKIRDDMNDFIKKRFSLLDLEKIYEYKQRNIDSIYDNRSLQLGIELIKSYNENQINKELSNEININKENAIKIMLVGNSASGKSTLIKCFVPKKYRSLLTPIIGIRETSIFRSFYYIINEYVKKELFYLINKDLKNNDSFIVLKPKFKSSEQIKDIIHQNFFNFIKKINIYILENINADIIENSKQADELWKKSIRQSIESFLIDDRKIFNLQLLLGKYEEQLLENDVSVYKKLFDLLENYILRLEEFVLSNVSKIIDASDKKNFLKANKFQYILTKKQGIKENVNESVNKELILEQIDTLYNAIIESNREELEVDIYNFLFEEFIKIFEENFGSGMYKDIEINNIMEYYDKIKKINEEYIPYKLPADNHSSNLDKENMKALKVENSRLSSDISKVLKSFYANNKSAAVEKKYIAPLVEKMNVYLPQNQEIIEFDKEKIFCFIDTVGLDHGKDIDKRIVAKRFQSYLNENEPDFILLNINFKEKIDLLEEAINYIDTVGMLNKTLILPSYVDELFKDRTKTEYLSSYIEDEEFEELISNKQITLSSKAKENFDEKYMMGTFNLEDIEKEDEFKIIDILMKKHFDQIYKHVTDVLISDEIKKSFTSIDQSKLLDRIIYIDRVDELSKFENKYELKPESAINNVIRILYKNNTFFNKISEFTININYDEYIVLLKILLEKYKDEQKKLYEECNIHWATLDVGLRELKNNAVGQKWGSGYNITPAEDMQYNLIDLLNYTGNETRTRDKVFEINSSAIEDKEFENIKDEFFRLFNKYIGKTLHYYFITNNMNVYETLYQVRYGENRMYYGISMTRERKLRLKEFLLNISQNIEKINVLIRVAFEEAKNELSDLIKK